MSAAVTHSGEPITPAEFDRLPVDTEHRYEIEDGRLLVNARPAALHSKTASRLVRRLGAQLPAEVEVIVEPEAELPDPSARRVPDLAIVPTDWEGARVRADQISLAIEIVSPGESWFRDYLKKPDEVRYRKPTGQITGSLLRHPTANSLPGLRGFARRTSVAA